MFVVAARYLAQKGKYEKVAELLREMAVYSNSDAEPGCALYIVNRSIDDQRRFLLYEQFVDRAAYDAHVAGEACQRIMVEQVLPLLEERERDFYLVLESPGLPGFLDVSGAP